MWATAENREGLTVLAHDLDRTAVDHLRTWLPRAAPHLGALVDLRKFPGGQSNPTYLLECAGGRAALRRKPFGQLLPKAHMIEREYAVMDALGKVDFPAPRMLAYCDDLEVIGSAFYLMEFVEGRIFWNPALPELNMADRRAVFDSMNRTVARLHALDPGEIGLGDFGRPAGFMARQVRLWTDQYRAAQTHDIPAMERLMEWLPGRLPPEPPRATLFHGDLRLDNMIFHPTEPRVLAVLDWELSTLGDPFADFAYHEMTWRIPPDLFRGLGGVDLDELGIPSEAAYRQSYLDRVGETTRAVDWTFYLAFGLFRAASIIQGIAKRAQQGNASSADAAEQGAKAGPLADLGWSIVQENP